MPTCNLSAIRQAGATAIRLILVTLSLAACHTVPTHPRFHTPPEPGDTLDWRAGPIHCRDVASARASAESGFMAPGCRRFERDEYWTVTHCERAALSHGPVYFVEIAAGRQKRWMAFPWHNWA